MRPKQGNSPSSKQLNKPQSGLSVDALTKLAEQAYEEFSPGIAAKYYEDAIKQKPNDADLYHKLALMYVEYGDPEQAHKAFLKSIELSPDTNESNYLYIGQQCYGIAAKSAFEKGIELMVKQLSSTDSQKEISRLNLEISNAYVSIAELFMTDLCEEEDAQIQCENYLNLSIKYDKNNIESYATFGQFRHCQQRDQDAIKYFAISLQKLFGGADDDHNETKDNEDNTDNADKIESKLDIFNVESLSIDSFMKIIKLGIELEQYQPCVRVLKYLVNANEEIGECWALGAYCHYKLREHKEAAIWLNNAESIAETAGGESINFELQQTLETIKSEMNVNELPDISKLSLDDLNDNDDEKDINANNDNDKLDIDSFLEDDEDDDDDDVDLIQDKIKTMKSCIGNGMQIANEEEDVDINNNNEDMIDID